MLKEPARSFQSCRDYVTAYSFYEYACGPNAPISAPDKLLLSYLSSWRLFNLEIFSYIVLGTWEDLGWRANLQGQAVIRCHASTYPTEQNTTWGKGWPSENTGEKKKLVENVTKLVADPWFCKYFLHLTTNYGVVHCAMKICNTCTPFTSLLHLRKSNGPTERRGMGLTWYQLRCLLQLLLLILIPYAMDISLV